MVMPMWSVRSQKRLLYCASVVCALATLGVWAWCGWSMSRPPQAVLNAAPHTDDARTAHPALLGAQQLEVDHTLRSLEEAAEGLDLSRPLFDPPPTPVVVAVPPPPPPLRLTLVGTVHGRGEPQAILTDANGRMQFLRVGESIANATVNLVGQDYVELTFHGERRTLRIEGS